MKSKIITLVLWQWALAGIDLSLIVFEESTSNLNVGSRVQSLIDVLPASQKNQFVKEDLMKEKIELPSQEGVAVVFMAAVAICLLLGLVMIFFMNWKIGGRYEDLVEVLEFSSQNWEENWYAVASSF